MIDFKPIATTDKELLTSFILPSDEQDCDFSFANLCSWHFMTESSYALIEDHLVIRFVTSEGNHEYFMPLGEGSPIPVIEALEACALSENEPLCLRGVQPKIQDKLEQYFPTLFEYTSNRDYFDYIYRRQDLAELKGKHYQPKRNHVNKFRKEYRYNYEPLTPDLIPVCLQFESEWYETRLYRKRKHPERTACFDLCLTSFRRTGFDRRCDQCRRQDCSFHFRSPYQPQHLRGAL